MKNLPHPAFWWLWAIFLVIALIRFDSLLFSAAAVLVMFAMSRTLEIPVHRLRIFNFALLIAGFAVAIRAITALLIGVPMPGRTIFTLPQLQLPELLVGIRVGGPVTVDRLSGALSEALLFASLILAFALANAASTPTRLLRVIPPRFYGAGIAASLAATITPQLAMSVRRIRSAQLLRGQKDGLRSWRRIGTPVLEDSLARSIDLAAALEARGYGRSNQQTRYRPERWRSVDSVGLMTIAYLALVAPTLTLPILLTLLVFVLLTFSAAVIR